MPKPKTKVENKTDTVETNETKAITSSDELVGEKDVDKAKSTKDDVETKQVNNEPVQSVGPLIDRLKGLRSRELPDDVVKRISNYL